MFRKVFRIPCLTALALALTFALAPGSALAQHGGGGGGGGGGGHGGGGEGGGIATLTAPLAGTDADPDAFGLASLVDLGTSSRLEVEVEDVTYSADVLVVVNGTVLLELFLVDGGASAELELEHIGTGYYGTPSGSLIPINPGDEIDIIDANDSTLLLVGVFG
jgi:hypothetical protein